MHFNYAHYNFDDFKWSFLNDESLKHKKGYNKIKIHLPMSEARSKRAIQDNHSDFVKRRGSRYEGAPTGHRQDNVNIKKEHLNAVDWGLFNI